MAATNSFGRAARRFANGVVWVLWGAPRAGLRWLVHRGSNLLAVLWLGGLAVFIGTVAVRAHATYLAEARQHKDDPVQPMPADAGVQRAVLVVADVEDAEAVMARRLQDIEGMEGDLDLGDGGTAGPMDGGALATLRALKALSKVRGAASPAEVAQLKAMIATELGGTAAQGTPVDAFAALSQDDVDVVFAGDGGLVGFLERNKNKARRRLDDPQTLALVAQQLSGEDIQNAALAPGAVEAPVASGPPGVEPAPNTGPLVVDAGVPPEAAAQVDAGATTMNPPTARSSINLRDVGHAVLDALLRSDLVRALDGDAGRLDAGTVFDAGPLEDVTADAGRLGDGGALDAGRAHAGHMLDEGSVDAGRTNDGGAPDAGRADAGLVGDVGGPDAGHADGGGALDARAFRPDGGATRTRRPKVTR